MTANLPDPAHSVMQTREKYHHPRRPKQIFIVTWPISVTRSMYSENQFVLHFLPSLTVWQDDLALAWLGWTALSRAGPDNHQYECSSFFLQA